ncbi:hypothetical protein ZWY2020_014007 [Hordeum vulgare]|nr:hypothetical protein ZWY2020_014007 [Hordeum vulgare]
MRKNLLQMLIKSFDVTKRRFVLQPKKVEMTVRSADVFHIYGLKNKGKDVIKHLATLEEGSKDYIPSRFLNEKTGTIVIDELIDHIVKSGSFDDDFVRRAVLVLIRTVIAPHSTKTVPRHLNSLVEDVDTIKLYNWNEFMLHVCIDGIAKKVKDQHKFKWPVGNLSLIQRLKKEGLIYKPSFNDINPKENGADESEVWVKRKYAPKYFPEVDSSPLDEHHQEEKNNASFTNMPIDEELNDDTGARINGSGIDTPNNPFIVNGNNSPVINAYCKQIKKRSKVPDRHILSTWVPKWLLDRAVGRVTGRKTKMELLVKRTTTITRVMDEYFITDNAYFPINVNGNHCITVLMYNTQKEFQVLDSFGPIDRNIRKTIHTLYEMPKQTDGVSCGLFVLRCIEYSDGEKWTSTFDQDEINESRSKILAELIFSEDNIVEKVKHKVLRLISRD